jgi:hypothetical protein
MSVITRIKKRLDYGPDTFYPYQDTTNNHLVEALRLPEDALVETDKGSLTLIPQGFYLVRSLSEMVAVPPAQFLKNYIPIGHREPARKSGIKPCVPKPR